MLSTGVDRVVDQVVNPKIYTDFKPQIDRVVCDHLGLDYDRWIARLSKYLRHYLTMTSPLNSITLQNVMQQDVIFTTFMLNITNK